LYDFRAAEIQAPRSTSQVCAAREALSAGQAFHAPPAGAQMPGHKVLDTAGGAGRMGLVTARQTHQSASEPRAGVSVLAVTAARLRRSWVLLRSGDSPC
jgi:hypothetical protein